MRLMAHCHFFKVANRKQLLAKVLLDYVIPPPNNYTHVVLHVRRKT
jgi:hypothetical protein